MVHGIFNPNDCPCDPCTREKAGQFVDFMYIKKYEINIKQKENQN